MFPCFDHVCTFKARGQNGVVQDGMVEHVKPSICPAQARKFGVASCSPLVHIVHYVL